MKEPCLICGFLFEGDGTHRGKTCPKCGQQYEYEEGWQIILTEEQKRLLLRTKYL